MTQRRLPPSEVDAGDSACLADALGGLEKRLGRLLGLPPVRHGSVGVLHPAD
jgi:hypothetical protein